MLFIARGSLAKEVESDHVDLELPDEATLDQVLDAVGLPRRPYVFVLNGVAMTRGASLKDGDRLEVHRHAAGG